MTSSFRTVVLKYALVLLACSIVIYPLLWMVTMAFKPVAEWTTGNGLTWFPKNPTLQNFEYIFFGHTAGLAVSLDRTVIGPLTASLVTSICGTVLAVVAGTLSSYAVVRHRTLPSLAISVLQLRLFPPLAVMIPVMVMWAFIGAIDTWWGLSLIYGIVTLPFAFWLMKTFFEEIPVEIEEAARVSGSSHWRVFYRITLPIVKPGLATCVLFVFIINWSDYLLALLLTQKNWVTLPVFMSTLNSAMGEMYGMKAALGLIAAIPPVVLGLLIQKHLVRGLTFGALKQ
ncbi:multiple sugar transport system permease protein [Kaistia soli DSM 19436]|uniref:Multiple sugar transport system permease protein n=1 Tax=Kaistia soli DSM 19436 TaxID=1122133 RepID=A0A1M5DYW1_9HYPH|nr:carbohydrate ABC transporter permease [Kaistia soli]SHF72130.1 multiple sugar transport system permease protein [Kaistia soli DSM 19436]